MQRFLISVAENGVFLRRILGITHDASTGEVRYATQPLRAGDFVDMLTTAVDPNAKLALDAFFEALTNLGHLVTRLRWESGVEPWETTGPTSSAPAASRAIVPAPGTTVTPSRPATAKPAQTVTRRAARPTSAGLSAAAPVFPASIWDEDDNA